MSADQDLSPDSQVASPASSSFSKSSEAEQSAVPCKRHRPVQPPIAPRKRPKLPSADLSSQSDADSVAAVGTKLGSRPSLSDLRSRREAVVERLRFLQQSFGRKCHPLAEPARVDTVWDFMLHEMVADR